MNKTVIMNKLFPLFPYQQLEMLKYPLKICVNELVDCEW